MRPSATFLGLSLALFLCASQGFAQTPLPAPSSAGSLFEEKPFGPLPEATPTPTVKTVNLDEEKPIWVGWYIGGGAVAALTAVALLYLAARAWRSSNLFDRQYYFPVGAEAAIRLGATRCGGHMATINFEDAAYSPTSKAKDA